MSKEKNRIFNTIQDEKFLFADTALLEEKDPKNPALSIHAAAGKKSREVLYALIDYASQEEIEEHRQVVMETLKEEEDLAADKTEREELMIYFREALLKIDPEASIDEEEFSQQTIEELREMKLETEKTLISTKEAADAQEAETIRKELTDMKIAFNKQLGLKKLRALLKEVKDKKPEKPAAKTKEEKEAAVKEAKEIRELLIKNNVKFDKKTGLIKLREKKAALEAAQQKKADLEEVETITAFLTSNEITIPTDATLEDLRSLRVTTEEAIKAAVEETPAAEASPSDDADQAKEEAPAADKAEAAAADKKESTEEAPESKDASGSEEEKKSE